MKYRMIQVAMLAIMVAAPSIASAGLMDCLKGGGCCAEKVTCCTKCVPEYKTEKVKKHCWCTECDEVCIPPVTLPCCKSMFGKLCGRGKCGGCSDGSCGSCGSCCETKCCNNGLLKKLFGCCAGCRTRCVSKLKKHEYECEKCVVEWKCVRCGCCDNGCCETGACCEPQCCAPACQ